MQGATAPFSDSASEGWKASLVVSALGGPPRTRIWKEHRGPLYLQRAFYPEDDGTAHLYLLHPPGGVVGGDEMDIRMALEDQAALLVTTPGSGKFYRSLGKTAVQRQQFDLAAGTQLEWLPQETILFEQSRTQLTTRVNLAQGARYIGWELLCFGRPASGQTFADGYCRQRLEIWQDQKPLWIDRAAYDGGSGMLSAAAGLASFTLYGTLVATLLDGSTGPRIADRIRDSVQARSEEWFGVTLCDAVLVCRYLGQSAEQAKQLFTLAWKLIRLELLKKEAVMPRIWRT